MTEDQIGQLGYLVLLLVAVGGYFLIENRDRIGHLIKQAALWALIFTGLVAGVGLWSDIRTTVAPQQSVFSDIGRVEVPRSPDGHYYLTLELDGVPVRFVVDTGATDIVLSDKDAERVGIARDEMMYTGQARTANGVVRTARTWIDEMKLGEIVDANVPVWVTEGDMHGSLLGMAYLQRFERIQISGNELTLER